MRTMRIRRFHPQDLQLLSRMKHLMEWTWSRDHPTKATPTPPKARSIGSTPAAPPRGTCNRPSLPLDSWVATSSNATSPVLGRTPCTTTWRVWRTTTFPWSTLPISTDRCISTNASIQDATRCDADTMHLIDSIGLLACYSYMFGCWVYCLDFSLLSKYIVKLFCFFYLFRCSLRYLLWMVTYVFMEEGEDAVSMATHSCRLAPPHTLTHTASTLVLAVVQVDLELMPAQALLPPIITPPPPAQAHRSHLFPQNPMAIHRSHPSIHAHHNSLT